MSMSNVIADYARDVVAGSIPAGKYHRLACARHLKDIGRQGSADFPYTFDYGRADRVIRFFAKLKHYKGEWAGSPIVLAPWQQFIEGSICGWTRTRDGLRRFRQSYVEVPRKQGKSLLGGGNADYFTFFDNEPGAEGYVAATKRDQARIVFNDAKKLVQSSGLKSRIAVRVSNLSSEATSSKLEPLGSDSDSTDGLNPHVVVIDEYHAHKTRALVDVLETAMGARRQPLMFKITTAGDNPVSPCGDEHTYACNILDGIFDDETYFAFIAHADVDDDWQSEATWIKANPAWNVSVKPDDMRALAAKAKNMPSAAATFKQKRLGLWVNATAPCLSVEGWKRGQSDWNESDLIGEPCYVGVDLASLLDLCALALLFPPSESRKVWRLIMRIWTPLDTLADRAHRDRAPYGVWASQGWLQTTPGTRLDHDVVRQAILDARAKYRIEQIGFDPWHADTPIKNLTVLDGFSDEQVLAVPQTYAGMSAACLRMQAEIADQQVDGRGCPVTAWSVSNTVGQRDGKDNLMFTKKHSRGRIDPIIAATTAMSLAIRHELPAENVYNERGVRSLADYL